MATQPLSPAELETIDTSRFEQVNGKLIERPVPTRPHGRLQRHIANLLSLAVEELGLEAEAEVSINHWDEPKSDWLTPDVIVSIAGGFKEAENGHVLPPLLLAIEVLSPGQTFSNMRWKASDLLAWGVQQVWLVDENSKSVAVFSSHDASKLETFYDGSVALTGINLSFTLNDLFRYRTFRR